MLAVCVKNIKIYPVHYYATPPAMIYAKVFIQGIPFYPNAMLDAHLKSHPYLSRLFRHLQDILRDSDTSNIQHTQALADNNGKHIN